MRRLLVYPLAILGAAAAGLFATATAASAHGYVIAPQSRQALCKEQPALNCGQIQFEPQSVEAPKGRTQCSGGDAKWAVLDDNSRNWPVKSVGTSVQFTWTFTARHRTLNWEYFVNGTKVKTVAGVDGAETVVTHTVDLSAFKGRRTVLAVWNIGDTPMAFYSCVDLNIGGGGATNPQPEPPAPSASASKPAGNKPPGGNEPPAGNNGAVKPPANGNPAPPQGGAQAGDWVPNRAYRTSDVVTFQGKKFKCRQGHTSLPSWEPSIYTLALWLPQ